jgi:sulfate transport system substrate-binding protein
VGDVHLTWENEAHLEIAEAKGELEIVYPRTSIRAEPYVAIVDKNVDRKGTRAAAEEYLKFVYTEAAQEILAKHHYRPTNETVLKKHADRFPAVELIPITRIAKDWNDAREKFFADRAIFDQVQEAVSKNRKQ